MAELTYRDAVARGIAQEMERDPDVIFFGGFALFSLVGCAHQDARKRATRGAELAAYFAETSLLPFGAILAGRNRLVLAELPWLGLAVGATIATTLYLLHPYMFGT